MGDYLIHYGTIGQKWGIRRYQNPDGTLTPEGRRRYSSGEKRIIKEATRDAQKSMNAKMQYGEGAGIKRRHVEAEIQSKMSNDLYRETFEYQYENADANLAVAKAKRTDAAKKGKEAGKKVLKFAGGIAVALISYAVMKEGYRIIDDGFKKAEARRAASNNGW